MRYYIYNKVWLVSTLLLCLVTSCGRRGDGAKTEETMAQLANLEDSIAAKSPHVRKIIMAALGSAPDSLTYYEYYVRLGKMYYLSSTPDSMHTYIDATISFAKRQPESSRRNSLLAYAYNCKAANYHNFHKHTNDVISLYRKADSLLDRSQYQAQRPMVCANLGDAYLFKKQLVEAASWYRRALFLVDSLKLPKQENVTLYMGLATIYQQLNDFKTSLRYYQQTDRFFSTMSASMQAYFLNNFGNYYYYTKDYKTAEKKFLALRRLLEKERMQDHFDMCVCQVNLADVYLNLGELAKAEHNLDEVDAFLGKQRDDVVAYYATSIRIGLAIKRGRMDAVRQLLSEEQVSDTPVPFMVKQIRNKYLRKYYYAIGDYKKAYSNLVEDVRANDSLEHNRTNMRASEIMERFMQDTLQLHHNLFIEKKNAEVQRAHFVTSVVVGLVLVVLLLFVLWVVRDRKRNLQNQMRIMRLRLGSARNRISPHFVFNVLNNKIVNSEAKEADELLELAHLIRENLDLSCQMEVSLQEELSFVERYVRVECPLLDNELTFRVEVADDVDASSVKIPSMFVQILVENAFVHGLRGWSGPKRLAVVVRRSGDAVCITVADNGKGFDIRSVAQKKRTGLGIITQTIAVVNERNKCKMRFSMVNRKDESGKVCGCEATLVIPTAVKLTF